MAGDKNATKTDAVVKLVLVFFVCLLSFSIGTFVGKKFSDSQHKIAKFEPETQEREVASVSPEAGEVKPGEALTDDEVAKLAEEFIAEDKNGVPTLGGHGEDEHKPTTDKHDELVKEANAGGHGEEHPAPAPKRTAQSVTNTHGESAHGAAKDERAAGGHGEAPSKAAEKVSKNENPSAWEKPAVKKTAQDRIPTALPKEIAGSAIGKYTVQVASYPDETEAQKMATDLKAKGFSSFYVSAKVKDKKAAAEKTWYRVSVGLFTTQKEAEAYKQDLLSRSKVSSAIVQKITE
ncbi:MAG: SPOR domain-containing protein [Bdellovibrionaceae bacterium]|nr:SPOR domain-containing protein [Pseudobdellovibrionaceae bacterium]